MYLHLGKGTVIDTAGIIGIFDLDITSQSHITRKYLTMSEKAGHVINAAEDIPKSFVELWRKNRRVSQPDGCGDPAAPRRGGRGKRIIILLGGTKWQTI